MITRDAAFADFTDSAPEDIVSGALAEHDRNTPALDRLRAYYDGDHPILHRVKSPGSSNNRLVTNHAKYIVDMTAAYLIGSPVSYADTDQPDAITHLLEAYRRCDIDSIDAELAKQAAIYGRATELLYLDIRGRPRSAALDPRHAFVIYDDTVAHQPLLGIHRALRRDAQGRAAGTLITVYSADTIYRFTDDRSRLAPLAPPEPHAFGGVPLVEFWNNEDERGDFAQVLPLIDAYNLLMSDRLNDKQQFVEAVLMISGASLGDTAADCDQTLRRIRDQRVLEMPAVGASAQYLSRQLDEHQSQILADAITRDIHKIAMVPALTDDHFAGTASGVALRYKLLGLEQLTKTKERWFREGLRSRMRLCAAALRALGAPPLDPETVRMTFSRGLPVNDLEQARMVSLLHGMVPEDALLRQLSFVEPDILHATENQKTSTD
jgi:SPP1 family phage portal protein